MWPEDPAPTSPPNGKSDLEDVWLAAEKVDVNGTINDILYVGYLSCDGGQGSFSTLLFVDDGDGLLPSQGDNGDYMFRFDFNPNNGTATFTMYRRITGSWQTQAIPGWGDRGQVRWRRRFRRGRAQPDGTQHLPQRRVPHDRRRRSDGDDHRRLAAVAAEGSRRRRAADDLDLRRRSTSSRPPTRRPSRALISSITSSTAPRPGRSTTRRSTSPASPAPPSPTPTSTRSTPRSSSARPTPGSVLISQPNYKIVEDTIPAGWALSTIVCSYTDIFSPTLETKNVTIFQNGAYVPGAKFLVPPTDFDNGTLPPVSCTMTNATSGIVIAKNGAGSATTFDFTVSGKPNQTVVLGASSNVIPFTPGSSVTITELAEAGTPAWSLTAVDCDDPGNAVRSGNGITVTTVAGQVITCTFTNNQAGRIVVNKTGAPTGGSFGFDHDVVDGNLDGNADNTIAIGGSFNTGDIAPGTYHVNELLAAVNGVADPDFVGSASCSITTSGSGTSTSSVAGVNATVNLGAGDIVTCTFSNVQNGRIIVAKNTVNGTDGDSFSFTGTGVNPGSITIQGNVGTTTLSKDVAPGTYGVAETPKPGYTLTDTSCSDSSAVGSIGVSAGEIVTCTFTNTRNSATFTLNKDWGDANAGEVVNLSASATGPAPIGSPIATSSTAPTDSGASMTVYSGQSIAFSEAFGVPANGGNYTSSVSCVDGQGNPVGLGPDDRRPQPQRHARGRQQPRQRHLHDLQHAQAGWRDRPEGVGQWPRRRPGRTQRRDRCRHAGAGHVHRTLGTGHQSRRRDARQRRRHPGLRRRHGQLLRVARRRRRSLHDHLGVHQPGHHVRHRHVRLGDDHPGRRRPELGHLHDHQHAQDRHARAHQASGTRAR